jgi:BirA family transcriptional regulator, biotin operon repressor / biotin---[acetyl-CoA-carboxylase] ligase
LAIEPGSDPPPSEFPMDLLGHVGVQSFSYLKQVESSNSYALQRLATDAPSHVWLVLAGSQTAGRGRGENRWWSENGALTFSLVVDAEEFCMPQWLWPRLSMAVGLAICQLLEREPWQLPMQLKWPNDVYVSGKKLGGILIEHFEKKLVIGIGLNVNQRFEGAPAEVRARATSLLLEMGENSDVYAVLVDVVRAVLEILPLVARDELELAHEAGNRNHLQWKCVTIRQGLTRTEGMCEGIDFDGALLVRTQTGICRVLSGTVELADK